MPVSTSNRTPQLGGVKWHPAGLGAGVCAMRIPAYRWIHLGGKIGDGKNAEKYDAYYLTMQQWLHTADMATNKNIAYQICD